MVVQDWFETVYQIEVPDPYPQTNAGQNLGALEVLPHLSVTYIISSCGWLTTSCNTVIGGRVIIQG